MSELKLGFGLVFADLYEAGGLGRLDTAFRSALAGKDEALAQRLTEARAAPGGVAPREESALLLDLAPHLEAFVGQLFGIGDALESLRERQEELAPLYACKRLFVQRRAARALAPDLDGVALTAALEAHLGVGFSELTFARQVMAWLADEPSCAAELDLALRYAAWALGSSPGRAVHGDGLLFHLPHKIDPQHLVPLETVPRDGVPQYRLPAGQRRVREGFDLTDRGTDLAGALDQANYCIWCHPQGKDSCTKGLRDRKTGAFQVSALGVPLNGCPLEEKISEMQYLKAHGRPLAALAVVVVDNPMCAGTGHRICNDCMKACIYQKQEPVGIPQVETRVLRDVLELPWGFELYSLLTRWNPMNLRRPLPRPATGHKVLVVGMGPAGYTLAHHLLSDGHAVVGIDGLKIEPLPADLSGVLPSGERVSFRPVREIADLWDRLDERVMAGFGGVAEYGITVRWDKNFLKVIRLLLERRTRMTIIGGVRFGGAVTVDDAFAVGFDHVALCSGAGRPTVIPMRNGLARGVRQASDFLMALQLSGAAKRDSIANLMVRLPIAVIGGGLTAIDTATESLAYYPVQVEKFLCRYDTLVAERGEAAVRARWNAEDVETAETFLVHARALRAERAAAAAEGRQPDLLRLLDGWGGATVVYRRRLTESPSYTLNHEEVALAMEEGIRFAEGLTPVAVETDSMDYAAGLRVRDRSGAEHVLPARTILVAAGTQPNTVPAREEPEFFVLDGKYFRAMDEDGTPVSPEHSPKPEKAAVLTARIADGRAVSFFGDLHPSWAGNVVRAMASARQGHVVISRMLARRKPTPISPAQIAASLNLELRATVHKVQRLAPNIIEVVVNAPRAAASFRPGQFYRLQNFESLSLRHGGGGGLATSLTMEGLALTGAWVDRDKGLIATIVLEMGGSSDLCAYLRPGDPVVLMGPTGTATEIPSDETVCLVGGGLGNAVLFSIGQASREAGSRVIYFAGYKAIQDRYKVEQIEAAADIVVWCCDEAPGFTPTRPGDFTFVGNIVQAMLAYARGDLGPVPVALSQVDRLIAIGSDRMMAAVNEARHGPLQSYLKPEHEALGSINSPMQCMMKEICAQCLQIHKDQVSGEEVVVFTCFNQDQKLDLVDFGCLNSRLRQNSVQEKLTVHWIDRTLRQLGLRSGGGIVAGGSKIS